MAESEARPFRSAVEYYRRYRLPFPPRLVARVAALAGLAPGDAVLDLGCGTGMLALEFARLGMVVTAMDPDDAMLAVARQDAAAAGLTIRFSAGGSEDLTARMGPFRLVTIGRAFHWMDRAATLDMLEAIIAPGGALALFHDAHPPVAENDWFKIVGKLAASYGRSVTATHALEGREGGHRRYEPYLYASAFTQLDGLSVTQCHALTVEEIVGRAFSLSLCAPERLGPRAGDFAAALTAALLAASPDGKFTEVAELVALVARRPEEQM